MMNLRVWPTVLVLFTLLPQTGFSDDAPTDSEVRSALQQAVHFFRQEVATEGGYLWRYSADLSKREGEGKAGPTTVWVQPPGTPAVGMAMLRAYELTGETDGLAGAVDAARMLVKGQLKSGGWNYRIECAPDDRRRWVYRSDEVHSRKARNTSVLDDNTTQSALRLLLRVDRALKGQDAEIHESLQIGLQALRDAQFDGGGWPQVFDGSVDPSVCPVRKASIPETWSKTYEGHQQYWYRPTLNDNLMSDVLDVLIEAADGSEKDPNWQAALRGGTFLLNAQLPEPQPGWAQQYNYRMEPMWARKFEPPSITGGEARGALQALMTLYRHTGDSRWIEPIPRALAYYRRSRLPSKQLARFYELKSNRPLYFDRKYHLTYDDRDMPTHYAFVIGNWVDAVEQQFRDLRPTPLAPRPPSRQVTQTRAALQALDARGAWVDEGTLKYHGQSDPTTRIIDCRTFIKNLTTLAEFIGSDLSRPGPD